MSQHYKAESIDTESKKDILSDDDEESSDGQESSVFCAPLLYRNASRISSLFIMNGRGDMIVEMVYQQQYHNVKDADLFYDWWANSNIRCSRDQLQQNQQPPMITLRNKHYLYIIRESMIFTVCSRQNLSPSLAFEFLYSVFSTLGDFLGEVSECNLQLNQYLVCEILSEMIDDGVIQTTSTSNLKTLVEEKPITFDDIHTSDYEETDISLKGIAKSAVSYSMWLGGTALSYTPVPKIADATGLSNIVNKVVPVATALATGMPSDLLQSSDIKSKKIVMDSRAGISQQNNKMFLDLTEEVSVLWSSNHDVIRIELTGRLCLRNFIPGKPKVEIALSNNLHIEELDNSPISAQHCVRLKQCCLHREVFTTEWEAFRSITLRAPEGETRIMTYRSTDNIRNPFKVFHHVHVVSAFCYEVLIKLRAEFPSTSTCKSATVVLDVLQGSSSAGFEFGVIKPTRSHDTQTASLKDNSIIWSATSIVGGAESALRCKISTVRPLPTTDELIVGPTSLSYEVIGWTASHVQVQYLRLASDRQFYKPEQYLRYKTLSNSSVKQKQQLSESNDVTPSVP